jgi:hypothetical protein
MPLGRSRKAKLDLQLNERNQFLAYGDDMNLLGVNIDTIKKKKKT